MKVLFILSFILYVHCTLFGIESLFTPSNSTVPVSFISFDLLSNSTTTLMEWTYESGTFIIGSAFDIENEIYYFSYQKGFPQQSLLSAINTTSLEFIFQGLEYSNGALVEWDIDIDSNSNIHFISRTNHSLCHHNMCTIDINTWNHITGESSIVIRSLTAVPKLSSLSYDETNNSTIIASHGSISLGHDMVYTLSNEYFISAYPSASDVSIQGSITWNRYQSKGYLIQLDTDNLFRIVQYLPNTNKYPIICNLDTPDSLVYRYSLTDVTAMDNQNNIISAIMNRVHSISLLYDRVIVTINLNTCEQTNTIYGLGRKLAFAAIEYSS